MFPLLQGINTPHTNPIHFCFKNIWTPQNVCTISWQTQWHMVHAAKRSFLTDHLKMYGPSSCCCCFFFKLVCLFFQGQVLLSYYQDWNKSIFSRPIWDLALKLLWGQLGWGSTWFQPLFLHCSPARLSTTKHNTATAISLCRGGWLGRWRWWGDVTRGGGVDGYFGVIIIITVFAVCGGGEFQSYPSWLGLLWIRVWHLRCRFVLIWALKE